MTVLSMIVVWATFAVDLNFADFGERQCEGHGGAAIRLRKLHRQGELMLIILELCKPYDNL